VAERPERAAARRSGQARAGARHDCRRGAAAARFIAGADAIGLTDQKVADLQAQIDAYRDLSTSLALDGSSPLKARGS
jgi:hypothetical protein